MGVTIFLGSRAQKMVGPRRPLRRSVPPGMLEWTEQPFPAVGEKLGSVGAAPARQDQA